MSGLFLRCFLSFLSRFPFRFFLAPGTIFTSVLYLFRLILWSILPTSILPLLQVTNPLFISIFVPRFVDFYEWTFSG